MSMDKGSCTGRNHTIKANDKSGARSSIFQGDPIHYTSIDFCTFVPLYLVLSWSLIRVLKSEVWCRSRLPDSTTWYRRYPLPAFCKMAPNLYMHDEIPQGVFLWSWRLRSLRCSNRCNEMLEVRYTYNMISPFKARCWFNCWFNF